VVPCEAAVSGEIPLRARAALLVGRGVAEASRAAHVGTGSVIGGRVSLTLDRDLLSILAGGREVALVSATNGKTTTTHLLATALSRHGPVVSNFLGANMPPGIVAALSHADPAARAVLEVDERWLASVLHDVGPATVVLLNLSRDQLDRSHEVRNIADTWRQTLHDQPTRHVIANADDPLVVWAASDAPDVIWVGTAAHWTNDAAGCPQCGGRIAFTSGEVPDDPGATVGHGTVDSWRCTACSFAKPDPDWWLDGSGDVPMARHRDGRAITLDLALPGRVNAANATMVIATAVAMGADGERAAAALRTVDSVAGRYRTATIDDARVRLLLAKNPAGWQESIDMLGPAPRPLVAAINARIADGRDPSWLWDVPFERLAGRFVVALGERRHDLAVRLHYAGVEHAVAETLTEAVRRAHERAQADTGADDVDLIANYTAFQDYLDETGSRDPS
jgi:UDP-N-acetylmuramyl tripeptide synthase